MLPQKSEIDKSSGLSFGRASFSGELPASNLVPKFLLFARYELSLREDTVKKYNYSLKQFFDAVGDLKPGDIGLSDMTLLKQKMTDRGVKGSGQASVVYALKAFLKYCEEVLELKVLSYKKLRPPRIPRRDVIFLTKEEIEQFVESIPIYKGWNGKTPGKYVRMDALRFRTLVEVLLGTGMRISEALSLYRGDIDFDKAEAKIVGKGNKERIVFFTGRSLEWVQFYLKQRTDNEAKLFVGRTLTPIKTYDVSKFFKCYREKLGINKKITPHILRHSVATHLLFNGCPISHVKEILGHERLETTCRYYLGLDKTKAKEAHSKYLKF